MFEFIVWASVCGAVRTQMHFWSACYSPFLSFFNSYTQIQTMTDAFNQPHHAPPAHWLTTQTNCVRFHDYFIVVTISCAFNEQQKKEKNWWLVKYGHGNDKPTTLPVEWRAETADNPSHWNWNQNMLSIWHARHAYHHSSNQPCMFGWTRVCNRTLSELLWPVVAWILIRTQVSRWKNKDESRNKDDAMALHFQERANKQRTTIPSTPSGGIIQKYSQNCLRICVVFYLHR